MMLGRENHKDFYSSIYDYELMDGATPFGRSTVAYQAYRYTDVSNLKQTRGYLLMISQRLVIPNPSSYVPGMSNITRYEYPAIIENKMDLELNNKAKLKITNIFPKTLNSSVTESSSTESGTTSSTTQQNTSGSSYSNVNTFGVSLVAGTVMYSPLVSVGLNYSHSWVEGGSRQTSTGKMQALSDTHHFGDSMSIKDWSAYSQLSEDSKSVSWVFGQTYPWDVILFHSSDSGDTIKLPKFIKERLMEDGSLMPPCELSLLGLDFVTRGVWLIEFPEGVQESEWLTVKHTTSKYTATHRVDGGQVYATLQAASEASTASYTTDKLDLSLHAIAPISSGSYAESVGTIGFLEEDFTYVPQKWTDQFKILSPNSDVEARGTGFDSVMVSTFQSEPELTLYFKVDNVSVSYELILMHWIEMSGSDCQIQWAINDKHTGINILNRGKNGDGKSVMTRISLRNLNYGSLNFHNYLFLGLNKVEIKVKPINPATATKYTLSSASVIQSSQ